MMISKRNFYSLIDKDGVIGVKKQYGYQIESDDFTIYAYERFYKSKIHFIDPNTGSSLHCEEHVGGIDDLKGNLDDLIAICRENLEKVKKTKEYSLRVRIFNKYKKARLFDEECKSVIQNIRKKESV